MREKIVAIIGGGFAGVRAALDLARHKRDLKIILIDKNGYHSYTPDYYKLLSPSPDHKEHFSRAKFRLMFSSVTIPLAEIFEGSENVEIMIAEADGFNFKNKSVKLASGEEIKYDWLIIAAGSVSNFYGIPGLKSRALEFKTTADSLNVRNAIDEVFSCKAKQEAINIVVGGGGFTGCEVASEIINFTDQLSYLHGHPKDSVRVSIIEGSAMILGALGEWARKKAEERLKNLGVKIIVSDPVVDVQDGIISLKSGRPVAYDVLIWTAGVKANDLAEKITDIEKGKGSCIVVDKYLHPDKREDIFVLGDIAYCEGFDKKPLPMTAQTAISHGIYAAYSVKRKLCGRKVFKYHPRQSRFVMPLGGKYAVIDLGWLKLSGLFGWFLKRFIALGYFLSILPFRKALKIWLYGARF